MAEKVYLTPPGYARIKGEFEQLGGVERPQVVRGVQAAAAEGDRSENAEYIYGKKRLREIDKRMYFLQKILDAALVVDPKEFIKQKNVNKEQIYFGATVLLEDEDGKQLIYQLVGEHEIDTQLGQISYASPVGRALLKKKVGDDVVVETPKGKREFSVLEVRYV